MKDETKRPQPPEGGGGGPYGPTMETRAREALRGMDAEQAADTGGVAVDAASVIEVKAPGDEGWVGTAANEAAFSLGESEVDPAWERSRIEGEAEEDVGP